MAYQKYRNIPTVIDNIRFASQAESRQYINLKILLNAGRIKNLVLQPRFELIPAYVNGAGEKIKKLEYVADFAYWDCDTDKIIIEDVKRKATATAVYKLKKKLFEYQHPDQIIHEVDA